MKKVLLCKAAMFAAAITVTGINPTIAHAAGLQAELRSSAAILPSSIPGAIAPTAPAGAVVVGAQTWECDAFQGFAPVVVISSGVVDPPLAIGTSGGIKLPISATTIPATCGQIALQANGAVYITQGVVDTKNTPSTARGVLRTTLDPNTGRPGRRVDLHRDRRRPRRKSANRCGDRAGRQSLRRIPQER